jgi:hypothetical protein
MNTITTTTILPSLSQILRPTVSRPVCLEIKQPSEAYDQILITARQVHVCWYGVISLARGRLCRLQLLLALASTVIFGSESRGTCDHVLLSQIRNFPFRRLLRVAGLRWTFWTSPPHGISILFFSTELFFITTLHGPRRKHSLTIVGRACLERRSIATGVTRLLLESSLPRECVYRVVA